MTYTIIFGNHGRGYFRYIRELRFRQSYWLHYPKAEWNQRKLTDRETYDLQYALGLLPPHYQVPTRQCQ